MENNLSPFNKSIIYFLNVDMLLNNTNISDNFKYILKQYKNITSDIFASFNFIDDPQNGLLHSSNSNSTLFVKILKLIQNTKYSSLQMLMNAIENSIKESNLNKEELFITLILFLYIFLQENAWGPSFIFIKETEKVDFEKDINKFNDNYFNFLIKNNLLKKDEIMKELSININEELYKHSNFIIFFYIPYYFLIQKNNSLNFEFFVVTLWKIRLLFILNKLVVVPVEYLHKEISKLYDQINIDNCEELKNEQLIKAYLQIEKSFILIRFHHYKECTDCIDKAKELLELSISLTGKMGKKTKYQDFETPVLVVSVENKNKENNENNNLEYQNNISFTPDNPLLDKPQLTNPEEEKYFSNQPITIKDQIYICALLNYLTKGLPDEELNREVILSYAEKALKTSNNWLVYSKLLLHRSLAENKSTKKLERSLLQIESLCNQFNDREPTPYTRMEYFFIIDYPLIFNLKKSYAELFMSFGCVSTAYTIFKELQMWEDAIKCLYASNKRSNAKELAMEVLKEHEEPGIYCILGELEENIEHFKKALEISNNKYIRAYRCLAKYYYYQKDDENAIINFEIALKANALFPDLWFNLGILYLKKNLFEKASHCFNVILSLKDEDSQVWGNLGYCFTKLNKLKEALKCFSEGYKRSHNDFKFLDNLIYVAIELKDLKEVIYALEKYYIIDKADKVKTSYFYFIVKMYLDNINNFNEHDRNYYKNKIFFIFEQYAYKDGLKKEIWDLYALFLEEVKFNKVDQNTLTQNDKNQIIKEIIEIRLKEIRTITLNEEWIKDKKIRDIVSNVLTIIKNASKSIIGDNDYINDKMFYCKGIEDKIQKQFKLELKNES